VSAPDPKHVEAKAQDARRRWADQYDEDQDGNSFLDGYRSGYTSGYAAGYQKAREGTDHV